VITTPETAYSMENPPEVFNADRAKQYSGATLTYYGDSVGIGAEMDQALAGAFSEATGITITVVPKPESATENYAAYQRFFSAQSPDVDVMMIDVIWPGAFAPHLVDLSQALGEEAKVHYETIIQNNTVDGKLVGMPWFGDFGMLYYRSDLLQKYGFSNPPETWDELEEMARTIAEGERGANPNFVGFVFQGNAYEGLT
jgi:trehalose/maltose transport system substrate-binding protein